MRPYITFSKRLSALLLHQNASSHPLIMSMYLRVPAEAFALAQVVVLLHYRLKADLISLCCLSSYL